mmetsp:Transcript_6570/g.18860  ORF Transcript_6570/g.18860 Transcript_6570/m.18860 type:complete len:323 (-) Transcript_6570:960-1928(-)
MKEFHPSVERQSLGDAREHPRHLWVSKGIRQCIGCRFRGGQLGLVLVHAHGIVVIVIVVIVVHGVADFSVGNDGPVPFVRPHVRKPPRAFFAKGYGHESIPAFVQRIPEFRAGQHQPPPGRIHLNLVHDDRFRPVELVELLVVARDHVPGEDSVFGVRGSIAAAAATRAGAMVFDKIFVAERHEVVAEQIRKNGQHQAAVSGSFSHVIPQGTENRLIERQRRERGESRLGSQAAAGLQQVSQDLHKPLHLRGFLGHRLAIHSHQEGEAPVLPRGPYDFGRHINGRSIQCAVVVFFCRLLYSLAIHLVQLGHGQDFLSLVVRR